MINQLTQRLRLPRLPAWLPRLLAWSAVLSLAYASMHAVDVPAADWHTEWAGERAFAVYPPWIAIVMWPVRSLALQNGLTLTVLAYALWRYRARPVHYLAAFTAMPVYWNLWLGQQEYIPLLGLLWLPWGLVLAAIKPQLAVWGALAWWLRRADRWKVLAWFAAGIALSFAVYGWWPSRLELPVTYFSPYNLSAWRWGGPLAGAAAVALALLVAFRTRDIDRSLAMGALASPYVQGNSYLLLLPALARLSGWRLLVGWLCSWAAALALLLGDAGRPLASLFPVAIVVLLTSRADRPAADDFRFGPAS
jgi:hypothetical protein